MADTLPPISEAKWQRQVLQYAHTVGWQSYHTRYSAGSGPGWPDLALCRPPRLVLAELKSAAGRLTSPQAIWLDLLGGCPGVEVYVWQPADLDDVIRILR